MKITGPIPPHTSEPRCIFQHSGDLGDLIYCLPVMRAVSKGEPFGLLLSPAIATVRRPWTNAWARNVVPLLTLQPYIAWVRMKQQGDRCTHDCNEFRAAIFRRHIQGKAIPYYLCDLYGTDYGCVDDSWLKVDELQHVENHPVAVSRSHRYRNPQFPWKRVAEQYRDKMVFVGFAEEHDDFCKQVAVVPWCQTHNMLDIARVIAGSVLFIGNQSACNAVAEGLKQNILQESFPFDPNCRYKRKGFFEGLHHNINIPRLEDLCENQKSADISSCPTA